MKKTTKGKKKLNADELAANPVYVYPDDIMVFEGGAPGSEDGGMADEVRAHAERTLSYQISPKSIDNISITPTCSLRLQYRLDPRMGWQDVTKADGSELVFTLDNKPGDGSDWGGQIRGFNGYLRLAIKDPAADPITVFAKAAIRG